MTQCRTCFWDGKCWLQNGNRIPPICQEYTSKKRMMEKIKNFKDKSKLEKIGTLTN